jgi:hydrogenase expression/formation protein HypE
VLADLCEATGLSLEIDERTIPLAPAARATAELLGLEPLTIANEGICLAVVAPAAAASVLAACRGHPLGREAAAIGQVTAALPALVEVRTRIGGRRILQRPYGEELPRIC